MIVVTGATGELGSRVVEHLLTRVPPERVGVSVRDPARAQSLHERGVRVRQGDYADAASLDHAFAGASRVLVVSAGSTGDGAVQQHRTAVEAAVRAGVERVVYTSHAGADATSPFPPMPDHAETEDVLRASGVAYTALRNGFYASFAAQLLERSGAAQTGVLRLPEDGPVTWTTHDDLAEAAAVALTGDDLDGVTPPLVAAEAVDLAGIAALAGELLGRPVTRVVVPDDEYRAELLQRVPEPAVDMLLGMFRAARQGDFAATDPALGRLLGRPPVPLRDVLAAAVPVG